MVTKVFITALALAATLTFSHILLKSASVDANFSGIWLLKLSISIALYVIVFLFYSFALRHFNISTLYPIYTALSILGVFFAGILLFNEVLTLQKTIGLVLLLVSIFLLV